MKIHEFFRNRMTELGMTSKTLAESMGIDKTYISAVMHEKRGIGDKTFTRLCIALGLDEQEVRKEYEDQIAPRGHLEAKKKDDDHEIINATVAKKKRVRNNNPKRLTQLEETDPAELFINAIHLFVCELNDDGKRIVMAMMKILTGIEAFKNNKQEENNEDTVH